MDNVTVEKEFWKNKKILVTGHTGFVGTWLCMVLQAYGAQITGLSLAPEENSLFNKVKDYLSIDDYFVDLRDLKGVDSAINKIQPDVVIHLAALGFVKECFSMPVESFATNASGTVHLFEAIRKCNSVKSILVVSSDKVYRNIDNKDNILFCEEDALGGIDIYSASKTCEDLITQSYYDTYFRNRSISVNIVRPGNILGGGDFIQSRLIPSLLRGFENNQPVEIRNRDAIRPWQNILDAIDAYITVIEKTYDQMELGIYNVGPTKKGQLTVGELSDYLQSKIEVQSNHVTDFLESAVREAEYLGLSIEHIQDELGWSPKMSILETLDDIVWFWNETKTGNVFDVCQTLIQRYCKKERAYGRKVWKTN